MTGHVHAFNDLRICEGCGLGAEEVQQGTIWREKRSAQQAAPLSRAALCDKVRAFYGLPKTAVLFAYRDDRTDDILIEHPTK